LHIDVLTLAVDVIRLFGDEGYNDRIASGSPISEDEKIALANFMDVRGGGISFSGSTPFHDALPYYG
jgi:hypothetical protein